MGISDADFIAAKERLIEQALRATTPPALPASLGLSVVGGGLRISTPPMSVVQIDQHRATVHGYLLRNFRSLSTAGILEMLRAAEDAMRTGGTVDISPPG